MTNKAFAGLVQAVIERTLFDWASENADRLTKAELAVILGDVGYGIRLAVRSDDGLTQEILRNLRYHKQLLVK